MIYDIALIFSFENLYKDIVNINSVCEVIGLKEETEYNNKYIVKIIRKGKFYNTKLILYTSKNDMFFPGDILNFQGEFYLPEEARNYKGFNYNNYLRQSKIYGIVYTEDVNKVFTKKDKFYFRGIILNSFSQNLEKIYDTSKNGFIEGILFGYTEKIDEEVKENFRIANISHILAISGLHVFYISYFTTIILEKILKNRNLEKIILIIILVLFCFITGESTSCKRACIMEIILIISFLNIKKYNFYRSYIISFFIIIISNPYNIFNLGMWLSYLGVLGIKKYSNFLYMIFNHYIKINQISQIIIQNLTMSLSVQITVFPIIIYNFNTISYLFLLSNVIVFLFIDKIIILGYLSIFFSFINLNLGLIFSNINEILIDIFFKIIEILSRLPLSKIYVKTPYFLCILTYYFLLFFIYIFYTKNKFYILRLFCSFNFVQIKLKRIYMKLKKILYITIIIVLIIVLFQIKNNYLEIYFVDVGQGDCTLIKTPKEKSILVDGGDGNSEKYDYGKKVVLPYLLDRKISKLDYIIISHFDSDHVGGIISIIKEIKVEKIVIGKQFVESENFKLFLEIAKEKNIQLQIVEVGDIIHIEKDLLFYVLWPTSEKIVNENILNNNSLVGKLVYKNFSMLFTGDIEEIAEKEILKKYENDQLNSTVLKVAHHGSKTSSTMEFLENVNPKYALIGVGKNNNFGHPSNVTIENLNKIGTNIFRTDENGEITIKTDGIKIKKINCCIKNKFQNFGINNSKLYILQIGDKNEKNYYLWNYNIWIFNRNRFLLCKFVENKSSKCVF